MNMSIEVAMSDSIHSNMTHVYIHTCIYTRMYIFYNCNIYITRSFWDADSQCRSCVTIFTHLYIKLPIFHFKWVAKRSSGVVSSIITFVVSIVMGGWKGNLVWFAPSFFHLSVFLLNSHGMAARINRVYSLTPYILFSCFLIL